jgi:hypothetical protein
LSKISSEILFLPAGDAPLKKRGEVIRVTESLVLENVSADLDYDVKSF